jgi:diguanylate cyclase (GGDEF)-like protein/PAS domain S-box-containing protein
VIVLVANLAIGMAISVIVLRRNADDRLRFDVVLAAANGEVSQRQAGVWQALVEHDATTLRRDVTRLRRAVAVAAGHATRAGEATTSLADLRDAQHTYDARLAALSDAATTAVPATDVRALASAATAFDGRVERVAEAHERAADRSAIVADVETLFMMVLAAVMGILLFRKFAGARNAAEFRAMQERARSEARFRALVHHSSDIVLVLDAATTIRFQTPSVEHVLGYRASALVDRRLVDVVHPDDHLRMLAVHAEVMADNASPATITARWRREDGTWRHVESVHTNLLAEPDVQAIVVNARDVTERKELEDELAHNAFHDALTNLANRTLFNDRLAHAFDRRGRTAGTLAVLFVDLDDFKGVNDGLGHAAGDELLGQIAARLLRHVRAVDTVARLGGDEFAILVEDAPDDDAVLDVASHILEALHEAFVVDGTPIMVHASIGIATTASATASAEELMRQADVAMYAAKAGGKARFAMYDESMDAAVLGRLRLEAELRRAIDADELVVHYQPEVDLETGHVVALEALVRWNHPERGIIPPLEFIPIAEDSGLIVPLGRQVLHEACKQARAWHAQLPDRAPVGISVNLSPRELAQPDLVPAIREVLQRTGLPAASLTLEITETVVMADFAGSAEKLRALQALGVRVAIDDFGTGYSSLSYLERLPIDILKIDKSFVDRLEASEDPVMVRAITQLADALRLQLVAEGVEHPGQAAELRSLGCHLGQGYYFARPLPSEAVGRLLERDAPGTGGAWVDRAAS